MPLYNLKCEYGHTINDKLCSYEAAKKFICPSCGLIMQIVPVKSGGFKIFGFSADNNYSMDNISYDGDSNPTW